MASTALSLSRQGADAFQGVSSQKLGGQTLGSVRGIEKVAGGKWLSPLLSPQGTDRAPGKCDPSWRLLLGGIPTHSPHVTREQELWRVEELTEGHSFLCHPSPRPQDNSCILALIFTALQDRLGVFKRLFSWGDINTCFLLIGLQTDPESHCSPTWGKPREHR